MSNIIIVGDFLPLSGVTTFIDSVFLQSKTENQYFALNISGNPTTREKYLEHGWKYWTITAANENLIQHLHDWAYFFKNESVGYEVIYFNYSAMWNFVPILLAKLVYKKKVIIHAHNTFFGTDVSGIKRGVLLMLHKFGRLITANGIISQRLAVSTESAKWLFGRKQADTKIIPNGISLSDFSFRAKSRELLRNNIDRECVIYATVGVLEPRKNTEFAVQVFKYIHQVQPGAILWIVGDGTEMTRLKHLVEDLSLSSAVKFWGRVSDMAPLYSAIDVLLFPSKNEGLSMTIIEAQCAGVMVFPSDTIPLGRTISKLVQPLSVRKGPKYWADAVVSRALPTNRDFLIEMNNLGYDRLTMQSSVLECIDEVTK